MDYGKFAVIPTHNRPEQLWACVNLVAPQVDEIIVIDNASAPPMTSGDDRVNLFYDPEQPPNLSRLWNLGLGMAATFAKDDGLDEWYVAILNDDALPPSGWMNNVVQAMQRTGAVAGCSHPFGGQEQLLGAGVGPSVGTRLTGWAFVLRQPGLALDEQFGWWAGDDDLSMRARQGGGLVYAAGFPVPNTLANSSTNGVLAEQAARDMQAFVDKWGQRPW